MRRSAERLGAAGALGVEYSLPTGILIGIIQKFVGARSASPTALLVTIARRVRNVSAVDVKDVPYFLNVNNKLFNFIIPMCIFIYDSYCIFHFVAIVYRHFDVIANCISS